MAGLASAAPWSASLGFDATKLDGAVPKGTVLPRSQWKVRLKKLLFGCPPETLEIDELLTLMFIIFLRVCFSQRDEDALECANEDCQIHFGLIDRKHHCR